MEDFKDAKAAQELNLSEPIPTVLGGSCFCGDVSFTCKSNLPYPFMVCHCKSCCKTGGFYCINLAADKGSLEVSGRSSVRSFRCKLSTASYGVMDSLLRAN